MESSTWDCTYTSLRPTRQVEKTEAGRPAGEVRSEVGKRNGEGLCEEVERRSWTKERTPRKGRGGNAITNRKRKEECREWAAGGGREQGRRNLLFVPRGEDGSEERRVLLRRYCVPSCSVATL